MVNKNSQIKWNKLLHEDLEELLKEKAAMPINESLKKNKNSGSGP